MAEATTTTTPAAGTPEAEAAAKAAAAKEAREFIGDLVSNPQDLDDTKVTELYGKVRTKFEPKIKGEFETQSKAAVEKAVVDAVTKAKTEWEQTGKVVRVVPEAYTAAAPEKSLLDAESVKRVHAGARGAKLTNEETQHVIGLVDAEVKAFWDAKTAAYQKTASEWVGAVAADKEIGGDKLEANVELAKRVVAKFGSDALKEMFKHTGLGNNPEFVRLMVRIGKTMSDDQLVVPGAQSSGAAGKSTADLLYGGGAQAS